MQIWCPLEGTVILRLSCVCEFHLTLHLGVRFPHSLLCSICVTGFFSFLLLLLFLFSSSFFVVVFVFCCWFLVFCPRQLLLRINGRMSVVVFGWTSVHDLNLYICYFHWCDHAFLWVIVSDGWYHVECSGTSTPTLLPTLPVVCKAEVVAAVLVVRQWLSITQWTPLMTPPTPNPLSSMGKSGRT